MGTLTITALGNIFLALSAAGGSGAGNLLTPDPSEVYVSNSTTAASILFDFGSAQAWDSVFLGFTNLQPGSTWSLVSGPAPDSLATVHFNARPIVEPVVAYGINPYTARSVHLYAKLPELVAARYLRIDVVQPAGGAPISAGIFVANRCFQPTWPQELGGGRMVIDTATRERLPSGGFSFAEGSIKSGFQFTLGDLSEAELQTLYALARDRGERRPLLVVEDPDVTIGLNERIRWGVLDRLEPYERRGAGLTRWSLRVEDWS